MSTHRLTIPCTLEVSRTALGAVVTRVLGLTEFIRRDRCVNSSKGGCQLSYLVPRVIPTLWRWDQSLESIISLGLTVRKSESGFKSRSARLWNPCNWHFCAKQMRRMHPFQALANKAHARRQSPSLPLPGVRVQYTEPAYPHATTWPLSCSVTWSVLQAQPGALTREVNWLEHRPPFTKVASSIPCQGTCETQPMTA